LVEEERLPLEAAAQPSQAPLGSETILLVEDEEMVRALIRTILQRKGYRVIEAREGQEALKILDRLRETVALLITDTVMPGMNGLDLAREITRQRPETKVLFMSGYTDHALLDQGLLLTARQFLQKPFTPDVLAGKVREMLDAVRADETQPLV
jgi:DNA-binding NtrC family response regulator